MVHKIMSTKQQLESKKFKKDLNHNDTAILCNNEREISDDSNVDSSAGIAILSYTLKYGDDSKSTNAENFDGLLKPDSDDSAEEFEELKSGNINDENSNIAAVMQVYSRNPSTITNSLTSFAVPLGESVFYSDDEEDSEQQCKSDSDTADDLLPDASETGKSFFSGNKIKRSECKRSRSSSCDSLEEKILKFKAEKSMATDAAEQANWNFHSGSDDDSEVVANPSIAMLINAYNNNQSSQPTFFNCSGMEDLMTKSDDDHSESDISE